MVDAVAKKQKKGSLTEEDVCTLLKRYSATQVLVLLREVAQSPDAKIDWNALVKKTATGIESAREYQMLWRYLAYRQPLTEKVEAGAPPLDDDSDLEYELEASPPVSVEVTIEAANCVKVLALGSQNESSMPSSSAVEGDMPNGLSLQIFAENPHPSLLHSSNVTLPVSAQKQPQPAGISSEVLDANGAANIYPPRRKRKPWSEEEDLQLINAVKKHGEGCWAAIAKGEFNGNRTASQLSQRWGNLKKKPGSLNMGVNGSQLSEEHLATRHALQQALNNSLTAGCSVGNGAAGASNSSNISASNKDSHVTNMAVPSQQQLAQGTSTSTVKPGPMGPMSAPRPPLAPKKAPAKPSVTADSIQAVAVAAGARIASLSDAKSLFKAAQAKNTVHNFRGGSLIKSSSSGSTSSLPPNVHFICSGPPNVAAGATSSAASGHQVKGNAVKPSGPTASVSQLSKAKTVLTVASEQTNTDSSSCANELLQIEDKISDEVKVSGPDTKSVVDVQEDNVIHSRCLPEAPPEQGQSTSACTDVDLSKQRSDVTNSQSAGNKNLTKSEPVDGVSKRTIENPVPKNDEENLSAARESASTSVDGRRVADGVTEKMEVSSEALAGAKKSDPMEL